RLTLVIRHEHHRELSSHAWSGRLRPRQGGTTNVWHGICSQLLFGPPRPRYSSTLGTHATPNLVGAWDNGLAPYCRLQSLIEAMWYHIHRSSLLDVPSRK